MWDERALVLGKGLELYISVFGLHRHIDTAADNFWLLQYERRCYSSSRSVVEEGRTHDFGKLGDIIRSANCEDISTYQTGRRPVGAHLVLCILYYTSVMNKGMAGVQEDMMSLS